jgi:hypothetical protein
MNIDLINMGHEYGKFKGPISDFGISILNLQVIILSCDGVTIDGVWIGNWIY